MKNKKTTIYDIAAKLEISVGTVYRALNNKGRISPETKQRVLDMAQELDFEANQAAQSLRRSPIIIGVILCCTVRQYMDEIKRGIEAAFEELKQYNVFPDIRLFYEKNAETDIPALENTINDFTLNGVKGVIFFLSGNNRHFVSAVNKLEGSGIAVATVANDIEHSERSVSVSVDGQCAGRLASEILYLCCPGQRIAVLTGSNATTIHKENLTGFLEYSSSHRFSAIDIYEHEDQPERVVSQLNEILEASVPYQGLYITSASSIYACRHISQCKPVNKMKIITTDLFDENKLLLESETVCATIFQNPYKIGKNVVEQIYKRICNRNFNSQTLLTPLVVFKSNMGAY